MELKKSFNSIYSGKSVFVTGHTGFKGSWLSLWLTKLGATVAGYSLSQKTEPCHLNLLDLKINSSEGDIRNKELLTKKIKEVKPDIVFHLAAQPLVRDSYRDPNFTYETNVIGTLNVLEASRACSSVKAIINVTTDKVYENQEWHWGYRENDNLGGYDLYSSSKACSEMLTSSYRNSFFNISNYKDKHEVLLASARAGNVIGGGDWAFERIIPDIMRATIKKESTEVRSPQSIRPWEHVLEPLSGYLLLGQKLLEGKKDFAQAWNFGPDWKQCLTVEEILNLTKKYWPEVQWHKHELSDSFHEAKLLKLDCAKSIQELKWRHLWEIEKTIEKTVSWYRQFYSNKKINSEQDLLEYVSDAKKSNLPWA